MGEVYFLNSLMSLGQYLRVPQIDKRQVRLQFSEDGWFEPV